VEPKFLVLRNKPDKQKLVQASLAPLKTIELFPKKEKKHELEPSSCSLLQSGFIQAPKKIKFNPKPATKPEEWKWILYLKPFEKKIKVEKQKNLEDLRTRVKQSIQNAFGFEIKTTLVFYDAESIVVSDLESEVPVSVDWN